jgi:hypothetical protein
LVALAIEDLQEVVAMYQVLKVIQDQQVHKVIGVVEVILAHSLLR